MPNCPSMASASSTCPIAASCTISPLEPRLASVASSTRSRARFRSYGSSVTATCERAPTASMACRSERSSGASCSELEDGDEGAQSRRTGRLTDGRGIGDEVLVVENDPEPVAEGEEGRALLEGSVGDSGGLGREGTGREGFERCENGGEMAPPRLPRPLHGVLSGVRQQYPAFSRPRGTCRSGHQSPSSRW